MKRLFFAIALLTLTSGTFIACTPENQVNEELQTDKDENCPSNDRNCNGIPDNQE